MSGLLSDARHFTRQQVFHSQKDRLPRSSVSVSSGTLALRSSVSNGNLLSTVTAKIMGRCAASLYFDFEDVPSALTCHGVDLTYAKFSHIIHAVGNKSRVDRQLSWVLTWKPLVLLGVFVFVWLIAFVLVIVLLLDAPTSSTLPIRLPVFVFPVIFVIIAYMLRWKRRRKCTALAMQMFNKCVETNQSLYDEGQTLVLTSARTETDVFHIYFLYYNLADCVKSVDEYLRVIPDTEEVKMATLLRFSARETDVLLQGTLAERLCTILAAPYAQRLLFGLNPQMDNNRHVVGKNQCLCQFVRDFVSDYLSRFDKTHNLSVPNDMFSNYVNLSLRKNSMKTVQELITSPSDDLGQLALIIQSHE